MSVTLPPPKRARGAHAPASRPSGPPPVGLHVRAGADGLPPSAQRGTYRACFERYLVEARALPAASVVVFRGDAGLALDNVRVALDNLADVAEKAATELPLVPHAAVFSTADVARAVVYAGMCVPQRATTAEVRKRSGAIAKPRAQMLGMARTLVARGALQADALDGVGTAKGPRAMATDVVKLAEVFSTHAHALQGQHPFTQAEIDKLRAEGEWLLEALKPGNARRRKVSREHTPAGDRDRLWTLLLLRYDTVRRVAYYFHGEAYARVAPPLMSSVHAHLPPETVDAPTPAPAPIA